MDFIRPFLASISSIYYLVVSPFAGPYPTPTITPTPSVHMVQASGSYSSAGQTVNVLLRFPESGGDVNGEMTGSCKGDISGTYSYPSGNLTGKVTGTCTMLFITLNAEADLQGVANLDQKTVEMNFVGRAGEYTHSGIIHLQLE